MCGDSVPKQKERTIERRQVSALTNLVFLASLGLTAYSFLAAHKLSLTATLAVSATLLLIRIFAERLVNRRAN